MHRTNVYLTDAQEQALDARARAEGTSRSAVLRAIVDGALGSDQLIDPALRRGFTELAAGYDQLVADLFDDDPDLRIDA